MSYIDAKSQVVRNTLLSVNRLPSSIWHEYCKIQKWSRFEVVGRSENRSILGRFITIPGNKTLPDDTMHAK